MRNVAVCQSRKKEESSWHELLVNTLKLLQLMLIIFALWKLNVSVVQIYHIDPPATSVEL